MSLSGGQAVCLREGGRAMTIISISDTAKKKVHNFALVTAQVLLGVALGCAMWFGLKDRLTFTVQTGEPVSAAVKLQVPKLSAPTYTIDDVPEALQELFLVNRDAWSFVAHYPARHDLHPEIDLSALAGSETVPRLYQWDERWGYERYNENFFARSGCGPTCLSMVDIFLTGHTEHDPLWMARFAEENGYNEVGSGTKWTLFSEGAQKLGLHAEGITLTDAYIWETLSRGTPIICVVGPGDFTLHGHYLVLTGIAENGGIIINDPNSRTRSMRTWSFAELKPQIRGGWAFTKA